MILCDMHRKKLNFTKYDFLKIFLVAWIILFCYFLKLLFFPPQSSVIKYDYLETEISQEHMSNANVDEILNQLLLFLSDESDSLDYTPKKKEKSDSSSSSLYERACSRNSDLCAKMNFSYDFSDNEKYYYFNQIDQAISLLEDPLSQYRSLWKTLESINLFLTKWNRRGSSSWYKMTFYLGGLKYENEFFQVLTHELWHIVDLGILQGTAKKKDHDFTEFNTPKFSIDDPSLEYYAFSRDSETIRKSWVKRKDFCSWYGMNDPFEDFAECHNLYLNHQKLFRFFTQSSDILKDKYNYFANLYAWMYFSNDEDHLDDFSPSSRVWDTTRMNQK